MDFCYACNNEIPKGDIFFQADHEYNISLSSQLREAYLSYRIAIISTLIGSHFVILFFNILNSNFFQMWVDFNITLHF